MLWALGASLQSKAGGSAENVLLIIDPADRDSLYVGNYYKSMRRIPDANILYFSASANSYTQFRQTNLAAAMGHLTQRQVSDHVDYIIVSAADEFAVSAPGLVTDSCAPVTRFSLSGAYSLARLAASIAAGQVSSLQLNGYYSGSDSFRAFSSQTGWSNGLPSGAPAAPRYFIGAQLGYTGSLGNTVAEVLQMIDSAVAVDGTRPAGNYYFMQTTDVLRSNPRHSAFPAAVSSIVGSGGSAQHLQNILPDNRDDCLGIMTGWASPGILTAPITIRPGAFCDHMTSFAATFDTGSQEKISLWIRRGAAGSWGAVEEPCNYPGKFPHARLHVYYHMGASLGEATFRSVAAAPFQGMLLGDPLTQPFARRPTVTLPSPPTGSIAGVRTFQPVVTANGVSIADVTMLVDGAARATLPPGQTFTLDTRTLSDGWHDLRFTARNSDAVGATGRWVGSMVVNNRGRSAALAISANGPSRSARLVCTVSANGNPLELRVRHNGRVVAAAAGPSPATLDLFGTQLGAGPVVLQAEALYVDGDRVRSVPQSITLADGAAQLTPALPRAYSSTQLVLDPDQPVVLEMPSAYGGESDTAGYEVVEAPHYGTAWLDANGTGAVYQPNLALQPDGCWTDSIRYRVTTPQGPSATATLHLQYRGCSILPGDANCDRAYSLADIAAFTYALTEPATYYEHFDRCLLSSADVNGDGALTVTDVGAFIQLVLLQLQ